MKNALITGITGQDGSYLAELLLEKGYNVYGIMRRKSVVDYGNVDHIKDKINFIYADMTDPISLISAMKISQADEVYNLAAQSFVATSWDTPIGTAEIDALGVRSDPYRKTKLPFLSGIYFRNVWKSTGDPTERDHTVLSEKSIRSSKTLRTLDHKELP